MKKENFQKILIIQTAFIGDVILATVVIEKLHQYYPEAKIDFLLRKGNESLLEKHPKLHQTLVWNKKENKKKNLRRLIKKIRENRYDLLINLQRFTSTGIIATFSKAKVKIGFDKNPLSFLYTKKIKHLFEEGVHEVDRNLALIRHLTDKERIRPQLYPSRENIKKVVPHQKNPYICIAPTSVWFTKQFAQNKWIEFIEQIDKKYTVFLLGAPQDQAACTQIIQKTTHPQLINLAGKLSLMDSAALMKNAVMNYVNDSAPMHLASAVNAPTCVVYCSTVPAFGFGPLAENSTIVEVKEELPCRPCGLHGKKSCPEEHFRCAQDININDLLAVLEHKS